MPLVLSDARIVDGTGAPWFRGLVRIDDGKITRVVRGGDHGLDSENTMKLDGAVLCPGFIDLHSHSDLEIFRDPSLAPKIRQGVTTEIVGQDGLSVAPVTQEAKAKEWADHLSGIAGRLKEDWQWSTIGEYLEAVDSIGTAPNIGTLVGHGTIRYKIMGWDNSAPTESELQRMEDQVTLGLEHGALGFSTGLEYYPQACASTNEVRRLAAKLSPFGLPFVAHIRSYRNNMWAALDEFIDIGASEDIHVHLSHFKLGHTKRGKARRAINLSRAARERGIDFTADLYPYGPGSTTLTKLIPLWAFEAGPEKLVENLKEPEVRKRIKEDLMENTGGREIDWDDIILCNVGTERNHNNIGSTIAEIADRLEKTPTNTVCDLLVEENLEATVVVGAKGNEFKTEDVEEIISNDLVGIGTDSIFGGKPNPRTFGSYPRILGEYVRDKDLLGLEEAIRKMTSLPARIVGLDKKGLIRPGMDADLVILQPEEVKSNATLDDPKQFAVGISHVLVDGEFVVKDSNLTGKLPGKAIGG